MATNFYFNNFQNSQEQLLLENLIIEAIKIYGEDIYYLPRNLGNLDKLYTADDQSYYDKAYFVEMYIKSVDGFSGDGNFMSKFGLEIRDQVVFSVAQRVFSEEVGTPCNILRPREGDLIWFPLNQKCFQIKFVNKFEMFYQLGALQTWEMTCELFEYSNEQLNTGIPEIDRIQQRLSTNILDYSIITEDEDYYLTDEDGNYLVNENYDLEEIVGTGINDVIQQESDTFVDWSVHDPFSEGNI
ncbi:MAG: hypothetical protein ACO294_08040 [Methylococcales bacterium]|jgi:hypothetical protein